MLILGIESATSQVGCAIGENEGVIASAHSGQSRRHAETLTPQIEFLLKQARLDISEIGVVAVDVGPGLYTGLRVGISTAMATAFALGVPMIGISSLDLLAYPLRYSNRLIAAAIDARRGELFTATYRQSATGLERVAEPRVVTPDELHSELHATGEDCLVVGDGALRYRDQFGELASVELVDESLAHPRAETLVALAHAMALRDEFVQPAEIAPLYLRRPDAEINWTSRTSS